MKRQKHSQTVFHSSIRAKTKEFKGKRKVAAGDNYKRTYPRR